MRLRSRVEALAVERGSVTAEFAAVLPAVVFVLAASIGGMQVVGEQLRLQAAAIDAARMLGRGDPDAAALVDQSVRGAILSAKSREGLACAEMRAPAVLGVLSSFTLRASACVLRDASH